jgi:uncharacterized protein YndB with AHSA1/START domain
MPEHVMVTREIQAPAAKVFEMVSHLERMGEWSPEAQGGTWIKGATGPALGAKFQGTNGNAKSTWKTTAAVTRFDPGKGFAFRVYVGPMRVALWNYSIAELTPTSCRVTESWTDQRGTIVKKLGAKSTGVTDRHEFTRTSMEQTLEKLAAAAEA